jgi:hypothetical protein
MLRLNPYGISRKPNRGAYSTAVNLWDYGLRAASQIPCAREPSVLEIHRSYGIRSGDWTGDPRPAQD